MIRPLADSSVWIDFLNPKAENRAKSRLRAFFDSGADLWICPVIYQEVLQGIRDDTAYIRVKAALVRCRLIESGIMAATEKAIEIYRALRRRGITIRKPNDCLVAAYAFLEDLTVLHNDQDYEMLHRYYGVKVFD